MIKVYFLLNRDDAAIVRSSRDVDGDEIFPAPSGFECDDSSSEDESLDEEV